MFINSVRMKIQAQAPPSCWALNSLWFPNKLGYANIYMQIYIYIYYMSIILAVMYT